jgi:hypothetical protein
MFFVIKITYNPTIIVSFPMKMWYYLNDDLKQMKA